MRKLLKIIGIAALAAVFTLPVFLNTGCRALGGGGNGTNTNVVDNTAIDAVAVILRGAARNGVIVAVTPPTGDTNNRQYFSLAANAIGEFVTGKDFSPTAFQQALLSIGVPDSPYVQLGVGTVIDLYQLYFNIYVKGNLEKNAPIAVEFLTAVQDGFNQALGTPPGPPILPGMRAGRPGQVRPPPIEGRVLPRPIKR
jgi:hypothetical protein